MVYSLNSGSHGTTFGGSPLACAIGHHVLDRLADPDFTAHIKAVSEHLHTRLERLPQWFPAVVQEGIRGRGLIRGIAFKDQSRPAKVMQLARDRGVLILTAGADAIRLVPSLTVSREEVDLAVDVLESSLLAL